MIKNKIDYLFEENLALKKELKQIANVVQFPQCSQVGQKSILLQQSRDISTLRLQIQELKCQLLLQRQTRVNEVSSLNEQIDELNQYILMLKEENLRMETVLEGLSRGSKRNIHTRLGCWRKESRASSTQFQSLLHQLRDPLTVFDLLDEFLKHSAERKKNKTISIEKSLETQTDMDADLNDYVNVPIDETKIKPTTLSDDTVVRWYEKTEFKQICKRSRGINMHLQLDEVKRIQRQHFNSKDQKKPPFTDVKLLKESYLELVIDFTALTKEVKLLKEYILELQSRNAIIINHYLNQQ